MRDSLQSIMMESKFDELAQKIEDTDTYLSVDNDHTERIKAQQARFKMAFQNDLKQWVEKQRAEMIDSLTDDVFNAMFQAIPIHLQTKALEGTNSADFHIGALLFKDAKRQLSLIPFTSLYQDEEFQIMRQNAYFEMVEIYHERIQMIASKWRSYSDVSVRICDQTAYGIVSPIHWLEFRW